MSERPPHAVLLREPARFDPVAVSGVLAGRSTLPAESLLPGVKRGWGVVAEPSPAEEAEALAAAFAAAGTAAVAVPASLIEDPPAPIAVTKADLSGDGFDIAAGRANVSPIRLSWSRLKVLSAGAVSERTLKTVADAPSAAQKTARFGLSVATGLPLLGDREKTRTVAEERRVEFVDLLFVDPARRARVLAAEFDFAILGQSMGYSAELNFRALVGELASRAPAALRSRGARAILAKAPSGALSYESFADAEAEERWLLALATLGAAL